MKWKITGGDIGYSRRAHQEIFCVYRSEDLRRSWPTDPVRFPHFHTHIAEAFDALHQLACESLLHSLDSRSQTRVAQALRGPPEFSVLRVILYHDDAVIPGEKDSVELDHSHTDSCLVALCVSRQAGLQVLERGSWLHVESGHYGVARLLSGEGLRPLGIEATRHRVVLVPQPGRKFRRLAFAFLLQGFVPESPPWQTRWLPLGIVCALTLAFLGRTK